MNTILNNSFDKIKNIKTKIETPNKINNKIYNKKIKINLNSKEFNKCCSSNINKKGNYKSNTTSINNKLDSLFDIESTIKEAQKIKNEMILISKNIYMSNNSNLKMSINNKSEKKLSFKDLKNMKIKSKSNKFNKKSYKMLNKVNTINYKNKPNKQNNKFCLNNNYKSSNNVNSFFKPGFIKYNNTKFDKYIEDDKHMFKHSFNTLMDNIKQNFFNENKLLSTLNYSNKHVNTFKDNIPFNIFKDELNRNNTLLIGTISKNTIEKKNMKIYNTNNSLYNTINNKNTFLDDIKVDKNRYLFKRDKVYDSESDQEVDNQYLNDCNNTNFNLISFNQKRTNSKDNYYLILNLKKVTNDIFINKRKLIDKQKTYYGFRYYLLFLIYFIMFFFIFVYKIFTVLLFYIYYLIRKTASDISNYKLKRSNAIEKSIFDCVLFFTLILALSFNSIEIIFQFYRYNFYICLFINVFIDIIFILDCLLSFIWTYTDCSNELIIKSLNKIFKNYISTWFILDLISCIPANTIINLCNLNYINQYYLNFNFYEKYFKHHFKDLFLIKYSNLHIVLRSILLVQKLLKLLKIYYCSKFTFGITYNQMLQSIGIIKNIRTLIKYFFFFILLCHLFSCYWIWISYFNYPNWITSNGLDINNSIYANEYLLEINYFDKYNISNNNSNSTSLFFNYYNTPNTIIPKFNDEYSSILNNKFKIYIASLYFNLTTLLTVGYGDIIGYNTLEQNYQIFLMLIGMIIYTFIISNISNLVKESEDSNSYKDFLFDYLENARIKYELNNSLYTRIKKYLDYKYNNLATKKFNKSLLLDNLPPSTQHELTCIIYEDLIYLLNIFKPIRLLKDNNYYLNQPDFVVKLITKLIPFKANKNEIIVNKDELIEEMIFINKGIISIVSNNSSLIKLYKGEHFGNVYMIRNQSCPYTIKVCSKYCELFLLNKYDLVNLNNEFKSIFEKINENDVYNIQIIESLHNDIAYKNSSQICNLRIKTNESSNSTCNDLKKINNDLEYSFNLNSIDKSSISSKSSKYYSNKTVSRIKSDKESLSDNNQDKSKDVDSDISEKTDILYSIENLDIIEESDYESYEIVNNQISNKALLKNKTVFNSINKSYSKSNLFNNKVNSIVNLKLEELNTDSKYINKDSSYRSTSNDNKFNNSCNNYNSNSCIFKFENNIIGKNIDNSKLDNLKLKNKTLSKSNSTNNSQLAISNKLMKYYNKDISLKCNNIKPKSISYSKRKFSLLFLNKLSDIDKSTNFKNLANVENFKSSNILNDIKTNKYLYSNVMKSKTSNIKNCIYTDAISINKSFDLLDISNNTLSIKSKRFSRKDLSSNNSNSDKSLSSINYIKKKQAYINTNLPMKKNLIYKQNSKDSLLVIVNNKNTNSNEIKNGNFNFINKDIRTKIKYNSVYKNAKHINLNNINNNNDLNNYVVKRTHKKNITDISKLPNNDIKINLTGKNKLNSYEISKKSKILLHNKITADRKIKEQKNVYNSDKINNVFDKNISSNITDKKYCSLTKSKKTYKNNPLNSMILSKKILRRNTQIITKEMTDNVVLSAEILENPNTLIKNIYNKSVQTKINYLFICKNEPKNIIKRGSTILENKVDIDNIMKSNNRNSLLSNFKIKNKEKRTNKNSIKTPSNDLLNYELLNSFNLHNNNINKLDNYEEIYLNINNIINRLEKHITKIK